MRQEQPTGDRIRELALTYASAKSQSQTFSNLRLGKLPRVSYLRYITSMYPVVVGFNRALIRSVSKVDHVRQWRFVRGLARQIQEEQTHNQLWRNMLTAFGIAHEAIYMEFESYIARFSPDQMDSMSAAVIKAIRNDISNVSPASFPDAIFPEPVLALCHQMWMTAAYKDIPYWEHFGGQYGIEAIILEVVSNSVLPGVMKSPDLAFGLNTLRWWKEHVRSEQTPSRRRSAEQKHVELARLVLNKSSEANAISDSVVRRADDTMLLFLATALWHDFCGASFPIERYLPKLR